MDGQAAIEIKNLSKRYRGSINFAIKDLSLKVMPGEVYGFLGPNAAGKSTTIRTLMNFIQPTSGTAEILGQDIVSSSVKIKRQVGYLAGDVALYPKATGRQLLDFLAKLTPGGPNRVKELAKQFQAELNKPIGALSKGNRQKIGLIQAFMQEPAVLVLDEPTAGLDPLMQEQFFKLVAESKSRGAAIFLSSHNLAETQRICDRVGILKAGRLIREQPINAGELGRPVFRVTFKQSDTIKKLKADKTLKVLSDDGPSAVIQPNESITKALAAISHYEIVSFESEKLDLEDEFMEFYGDSG